MHNLRPFQRQFILSSSFLKYYFSAAIKGKGFPERNSPNIKINHHIIDSRDINELLRIHKSQQHLFNFINYSAFYKRLSQLSRDGVDLQTLSLLNSALFAKLLASEEWKQRDVSLTRSVVQLSFYLTKLLEAKGYNNNNSTAFTSAEKEKTMKDTQSNKSSLVEGNKSNGESQKSSSGSQNIDGKSSKQHNQSIQRDFENEGDSSIVHLSGKEWNEQTIELLAMLDDQGEFLFQEMNNQEKGNYIYSLAKRNRVDIITRLLPQLEETISNEQVELRSLLSTLFSLTICKVDISTLLPYFDAALLRLLSNSSSIQALSPRDFADILYCYAKHQKILGNSQLFIKIEQAAQANDSFQQQQQPQDPLHHAPRKLLGLFKNEREIDPLAVSGMLNSIGNFSEKKFSFDFYQRLENMLLLVRFKTPRQLANSFRGLAQFYTPFDLLYTHFERQALYFLSRGSFDNDVYSFSTILYFMAINGKGSLKFYQAAENFTINHLKMFNKRQLKLILFSFKSSLHYSLSRENKDKFIDNLLNVFSQFAAEEIPSVLQGFRHFEDNIQRSAIFFQFVMVKIDEIAVTPTIESISLILEIFAACRESNHNINLKEQLPKLSKELVQIVKNPIIQEELAAQQNKLILEALKQFFVESQELLVFLPK